MATYTFNPSFTLTNSTTIDLYLASLSPLPSAQTDTAGVVTNLRNSSYIDFSTPAPSFFPSISQMTAPPYTKSLSSSAFSTPMATFDDGVYRYDGYFDDLPNSYTSTEYLLVTQNIDAGILSMPQTTLREIATYDYAVALRQDIQDYFDAADYTNANKYITYCLNVILNLSSGGALSPVATLPSGTTVNIELPDTSAVFSYIYGGYSNFLENTLTSVNYEYTWDFTPEIATPQNHNITQTFDYPDGVYRCYSSVISSFETEGDYPALLNEGQDYLLVITSIQSQVDIFESNHNPNDPAQVALLEDLQEQLALVTTYFNEENYEGANDQIIVVQELLTQVTVCSGLTMTLGAGTTNQMVLTYTTLPSGVYENQSGTLSNTLTGEEYTFTGFPADSSDNQLILNSNDIGAGSSFSDGVWQASVTFTVEATFQCTAYALVVTNARCCVRKTQAKGGTCKNLMGKAEELSAWLETAIDEFNYEAYSVSNGFIKKINAVCSSCGCGC
jgi:hypothetical protein